MGFSVRLALWLLASSLLLHTALSGGHDHDGHDHGGHDDHDHGDHDDHDHGDHDDHDHGDHDGHDHGDDDDQFGHDHLGRPHGHGSGDEDCPTDDDHSDHGHDDHDHGHDHGDDHGDDDHDDHDHMGHSTHAKGECPATSYTFDGKHYVTIMEKAPSFTDMTVCSYVTTDERGVIPGVLGSLAHSAKNKNFAVIGQRESKKSLIRINLEGQTKKIFTALPPSKEIHVCMVSSIKDNTATLFLNGQRTRALKFNKKLRGIPAGGVITIGRIMNNKYPMYRGTIRNFMMWDRGLTEDEILKIATKDHCPSGAKVTLLEKDVVPQEANVPASACMGEEFDFDNTGDKVQYVEAGQELPDLKYVTICVKVTTDKFGIIPGTIASYATRDQPELISVGGERDGGVAKLRIIVRGKSQVLDGQFAPNTAYRFCLVYHLPHGHVITYINGIQARVVQFSPMDHLPGGGMIIVGQRQRKIGGCFDGALAYTGKLDDFTVWGRALTSEELMKIGTESLCPTDAVVTTDKSNIVPHGLYFNYQTCVSADYTLQNSASMVEYVDVKPTIPELAYLTTCSRVTTNAKGMIPGMIGSYATKDETKALQVGGEMGPNGPAFRITVNGLTAVKDVKFAPNTEYAFCVSLHLPHGHVLTYVNGQFTTDFEFKNPGSLPGGGKIILGQKQGCVGRCFDPKFAYNGKIRDFMIWDRVLSVEEMEQIFTSNQCPTDQIIDSTSQNAEKVSKPVS